MPDFTLFFAGQIIIPAIIFIEYNIIMGSGHMPCEKTYQYFTYIKLIILIAMQTVRIYIIPAESMVMV